MTLSEQIAPVLELSRRKRHVVVPEWLQPEAKSDYWWDARLYPKSNERSTHIVIHPDAARLIVTGSLAKWLAGHGIAVIFDAALVSNPDDGKNWSVYRHNAPRADQWDWLEDATDHLSALIAATNARLDELNDKEPSAPPPASSKEGA